MSRKAFLNSEMIENSVVTLLSGSRIESGTVLDIGGSFGNKYGNYDFFAINEDKLSCAPENICAILLGKLDTYDNPGAVLKFASGKSLLLSVPVIIVCENIAYKDTAFDIFESIYTEGLEKKRHFTLKALNELIGPYGLSEISSNDIKPDSSEQKSDFSLCNSKNLCNEYLSWLKRTVDKTGDINTFVRMYNVSEPVRTVEQDNPGPFLSVITRTQGKRPEALREALLCLSGQSCTDFEVMIMGHNLDNVQGELVRGIIESQPEWLREKIRFIPVTGGTRTTPLNAGLKAANGKYIAILDDDDLVFDNWVEEFKNAADSHMGSIIHANAFSQYWSVTDTADGTQALRAESKFSDVYCKKFNILSQLYANRCPLMSLAFPRHAFSQYGIKFDESLTTTEDWDYLMRTAFVCGVYDIKEATSIYRLWENAESSQTLHDSDEWDANYSRIRKGFEGTPIVISIDQTTDIMGKLYKTNRTGESDACCFNADNALFYIDSGNGFNGMDTVQAVSSDSKGFSVECPGIADYDKVFGIRFDPFDAGPAMLEDITVTVCSDSGKQEYTCKQLRTNGRKVGENRIVFYIDDPQIVITGLGGKKVSNVILNFKYYDYIPSDVMNKIIKKPFNQTFFYRALRFVYRRLRSVVKH